MNVSLYQAASGLNVNARWQEVIAQNLASASVPGFKKEEVSFGKMAAGLMPEAAGSSHPMSLPVASTSINFAQGHFRATGVKTDLALGGPGFFTVQLPDGTLGYTRDGEFGFDPFGQLITKQGFPVMGNGGPIQTDVTRGEAISVSATGEVSQGRDQIGVLQVVEFDNPQLLTQTRNGYFLADRPGVNYQEAANTTVRQGFLETSNASTVTEMTQLITALRAFESNQRVIQVQDERMARLINELGNPN